MFDLSEAGP